MGCLLGGSVVGLKETSSQESLCHMRHVPGLLQQEPMSRRQAIADLCLHRRHSTLTGRSGSVFVGSGSWGQSLDPGAHKVLSESSEHLWQMWGLILFYSFFNWSIIALQCCAGFCCTTQWIVYMYAYIPHLLSLPPTLWIYSWCTSEKR